MDKIWLSVNCRYIMSASMMLPHCKFKPEDRIKVMDALNIFKWQCIEPAQEAKSFEEATYRIITYDEYIRFLLIYPECYTRTINNRFYVVFLSDEEFNEAMEISLGHEYKWQWKYSESSPGYEVTSRGDRRFSPFFQYFTYEGGLVKGEDYFKRFILPKKQDGTYVPGTGHRVMYDYLNEHKGLIFELAVIGRTLPFTDMFDKDGGQNLWYAEFLNEYVKQHETR